MKGGITADAAAQGETLIRTAIAAAANIVRLASFSEQGVQAIEWVAVIDDATTDATPLRLSNKR